MMDRYLRKVIESELDSALAAASDRFAALLKNRKKSWGPARFEIASVGSRRIFCGLSFDPRLDIFCPVLDWLTPEAKSSPHWYWYGHSRNTSQIWSEAPEHGFGSSKYPPAKPGALRLLAPQRGLFAIENSNSRKIFHQYACLPQEALQLASNASQFGSIFTSENVKLLLSPRQSRGISHNFFKLECPTGGYNVNISAVTRDSEEYRIWWTRMTKHPTWQEIMAPRARLYTRHAAQTICEIGLPLADDLARLFEQR